VPGHSQQQQQVQCSLYLVGPWESVSVDPSVWGFGFFMGVLNYQVRLATQRLVQWQCGNLPGWVPGVGMIPRLWRTADGALQPQTGLPALEAGQKRTWQQMVSGASNSSGNRAGVANFSDAALLSAYEAAWMRSAPARQHPRQRAAHAAGVVTVQRQQQLAAAAATGPVHNDLADPLTGLQHQPEDDAPWKAAFGRLTNKRLPKALKVFGWRLLHNGLWVGARKMYFRPVTECVCSHEECQQQHPVPLQTLCHVLLECPVARDVWAWFLGRWRQVDPGSVVAADDTQVLLLDELSGSQVDAHLRPLWTHLRLLLLESLWSGRGDPAHGRPAQSAAAVKHRFVAVLRQQIQNDWQRTLHDIRWNAGVPASWFRGRSPESAIEDFEHLWCAGGVLASVSRDPQTGSARLMFRLSAA
jgi:hypothetical protein